MFLEKLREKRSGLVKERLVTFICHGFGGILVERTLVLATSTSKTDRNRIHECAKGVPSFGQLLVAKENDAFRVMVAWVNCPTAKHLAEAGGAVDPKIECARTQAQ